MVRPYAVRSKGYKWQLLPAYTIWDLRLGMTYSIRVGSLPTVAFFLSWSYYAWKFLFLFLYCLLTHLSPSQSLPYLCNQPEIQRGGRSNPGTLYLILVPISIRISTQPDWKRLNAMLFTFFYNNTLKFTRWYDVLRETHNRSAVNLVPSEPATECRPVKALAWLPPIKNPSVWLRTAWVGDIVNLRFF